MIPDHPFELTTDWTYVRSTPDAQHRRSGPLHGRRLWRRRRAAGGKDGGGCDVYAYFNNDYDGHAVADRPLAGRPSSAPHWLG